MLSEAKHLAAHRASILYTLAEHLSLEKQPLHGKTVLDDLHSQNKPKKAHNYADFLINGHDDCTTYVRTLYRCLYSKA